MNLKGIRNLFGYTQNEFSKAVGISRDNLYEIERGDLRPPIAMRRKIKDFCDKNNIDFARYDACEASYHLSAMYGKRY